MADPVLEKSIHYSGKHSATIFKQKDKSGHVYYSVQSGISRTHFKTKAGAAAAIDRHYKKYGR